MLLCSSAGCDDDNNYNASGYSYKYPAWASGGSANIEVSVTGDIDVENCETGQEATVSFSRFPHSYKEFQEVRDRLKGTPQGAIALQLMAYELLRHNYDDGVKAIQLNTTSSKYQQCIDRMCDVFGITGVTDDSDGSDLRPYQVAAYLQGAMRDTGYNPDEPYTVKLTVSTNKSQYMGTFQTYMISFMIYTDGYDGGSRLGACALWTKKSGETNDGYIVWDASAIHLRVREIGYGTTFNGLK